MTANGSAVATSTDSPFAGGSVGTTEYGIITAAAFSTDTTLTVQVPEGYAIPTSGGVSSDFYSTQDVPYGFPRDKGKWEVTYLNRTLITKSAPAANTWYSGATANGEMALSIPIGAWKAGYYVTCSSNDNAGSTDIYISLSTSNSSESDDSFTNYHYIGATGATDTLVLGPSTREKYITLSAQTPYYLVIKSSASAATNIRVRGSDAPFYIKAILAYV